MVADGKTLNAFLIRLESRSLVVLPYFPPHDDFMRAKRLFCYSCINLGMNELVSL